MTDAPAPAHEFDWPDRVVIGTLGRPGARTFYLQVRTGPRLVSLALEKQQSALMAEMIDEILDDLMALEGNPHSVPASTPVELVDNDPLDPVQEWFRVGAIGLGWDPTTAQVLMMDDVQGHEAGAAGGVAQTAQRTGTALGLSVVMGAFYGTLGSAEAAASGTPSAVAHAHAASVALLLVGVSWAVTTAIALADLVRRRRRDRAAGVSAGTGRAADAR